MGFPAPITLRQFLTQPKPSVPCSFIGSSRGHRTAPDWPELVSITRWDDFNLEVLNDSYGHVLDDIVPGAPSLCSYEEEIPSLNGLTIAAEIDMKQVIRRGVAALDKTLPRSKEHMNIAPGIYLHNHCTETNEFLPVTIPGVRKNMLDHVMWLHDYPDTHLVIGLGRSSDKWNAFSLAHNLDAGTQHHGLEWPPTQLANICWRAQTRYGYIQTNENLGVFRFSVASPPSEGCVRPQLQAEMMAIPFSSFGTGALTTDLALWWLGMLAMSDRSHRRIVQTQTMVPISHWNDISGQDQQSREFRHSYSGRQVTVPFVLPVMAFPGTGQEGVGAQVGSMIMDSNVNNSGDNGVGLLADDDTGLANGMHDHF